MQKQKGITLVSLIITIVIMLMIAGVSISVLFDANGIIARGKLAAERANIADYSETLDNIGTALMPEKVEKGLSGKSYMDRYEEEIRKDAEDGSLKGSNITRQNDETVRVVTKEGYVFDVTDKEVKYIGKQGEEPTPPEIKEEDLEFKTDPEGPTNKDVVVTIIPKNIDENYTIQYVQKNLNEEPKETEWKNYVLGTEIKFTQMGNLFVRLTNKLSEGGKSYTHTVNNIDKQKPNAFTATAEKVAGNASNSIIVKGHTSDATATTAYSSSGIEAYYFKEVGASDSEEEIKQSGNWGDAVSPNGDNDVSKSFSGLTQNTTHYFVIKAVDKAGNETITPKVQASTEGVPGLVEADITISAEPSIPTKENVVVTITQNQTYAGYTLQYAQKNTGEVPGTNDWHDCKSGQQVTLTQNGNVYARLRDENNQSGNSLLTATGTINNIDKLEPNAFTATAEKVAGNASNSIIVKGHTSDATATTAYSSSGIEAYYFKEVGASDSEEEIKQSGNWGDAVSPNGDNDVSKPFSGLTQNTTHYFVIKAVDKAGNETITPKVEASTEGVPGLVEADITISAEPSIPTKENVVVTITQNQTYAGYTLQYAQKNTGEVPGTNDWHDCKSGQQVTLTQNGNVYARLRDENNQGGTSLLTATGTINNIDKLEPNAFTATAEKVAGNASNSIIVKGHTSDATATTAYSSSGIEAYYFKEVGASDSEEEIKQSGNWGDAVSPNGNNDVSKSFSGLTQNTTHYFVIKAVDKAGNETITPKVQASTEPVPGLTTADITFDAQPATWTKGSVVVTITQNTTPVGYTLQYAQKNTGETPSDTDWQNCTSGQQVTLTQNGNVYARLIDGNKQEGQVTQAGTCTVSNIDKTNPAGDKNGITTTVTDTQITANLNVTDTGGSGLAKVEWKYSAKNGGMGTAVDTNNWASLNTEVSKVGPASKTASTTITGLKGGTEYDIKAIIYDVAGNTTEVTKLAVKTNSIPVSSITVSPQTLSIKEKATGTLTATITPPNATDKTITWRSENDQIATVEGSGTTATVTGVKAGTTNIVVAAGGKEVKCSVSVIDQFEGLTKFGTLNPDEERSITIKCKLDSGEHIEGVEVCLYKVADINSDNSLNLYEWCDEYTCPELRRSFRIYTY